MRSSPHCRRRGEQGYLLMALLLAVTLILIAIAAGLPAISAQVHRQREEELIHRGVQYSRAIRNYYRHFHAYPASLDQLEDTNHLRFLRKRYADPMTGSDFRLLHVGEVQLVFKPATSTATGAGSTSTSGQSATPSPFVTLSAMGASGPSLGGGPIMGVTSTSEKQSFHVFNDKDHYNEWLFVYSPVLDRNGLLIGPFDGVHDLPHGLIPPPPAPDSIYNTPGTVRPNPIQP